MIEQVIRRKMISALLSALIITLFIGKGEFFLELASFTRLYLLVLSIIILVGVTCSIGVYHATRKITSSYVRNSVSFLLHLCCAAIILLLWKINERPIFHFHELFWLSIFIAAGCLWLFEFLLEMNVLRNRSVRRVLLTISIFAVTMYGFWQFVQYREHTYDFHYTQGEPYDETPITTQDGAYSAQAFYINWGGAAGGVTTYVSVIDHRQKNASRTVYAASSLQVPIMSWKDNRTLAIENNDEYSNYNATVDVLTDVYDASGRACLADDIQATYRCYEVIPGDRSFTPTDGRSNLDWFSRVIVTIF